MTRMDEFLYMWGNPTTIGLLSLVVIVAIVAGCATVNLNTEPTSSYPDTPTFKSVILESRDNPDVKWRVVLVSQCTQDMLCVDDALKGTYRECTPKECTHITFEEVIEPPTGTDEFYSTDIPCVTDVDLGVGDGETKYSIRSEP